MASKQLWEKVGVKDKHPTLIETRFPEKTIESLLCGRAISTIETQLYFFVISFAPRIRLLQCLFSNMKYIFPLQLS